MIPKIILQTSINKPEQYIIDKIMNKCYNWKYMHFTDDEIIIFFKNNYIEEFKDIIDKFYSMPTGAHKADLFRYYFLYINGGVFIDSDAMIISNIKNIIKKYKFFTVNSTNKNTIFQGFIGSIPKHDIIYKALKDAYTIDIDSLSKYYHLICYNLYNIIYNDKHLSKYTCIKIFEEKYYNDNCYEIYNSNDNKTVLLHYWRNKIIPK
jgi:mannosyltransferase OCH1-like enzyme